jgi:ABC-type sugar transport system ATPase subunit
MRFAAGDRIAILGESGSGKSTLVNLLCGLELPQKGRITLNGRNLHGIAPHDRQFGFVPQRPLPIPGCTVRELLRRPAIRSGPADVDNRIDTILRSLDIEELKGRPLSRLSGGQLQRVYIARVLVWEPQFLLLDEPFNSIDVRMKRTIYPIIRQHQLASGCALVVVTHDPQEALLLGNRIIVMRDGKIAVDRSADDLVATPPDVGCAMLLRGAATNLIDVTIDSVHDSGVTLSCVFGHIRGRCSAVNGNPLTIGRRLLGVVPWDQVISQDGSAEGAAKFALLDDTHTPLSAPVLYREGIQSIYGRGSSGGLTNLQLGAEVGEVLLYDPEHLTFFGRFEVGDA